MTLTPNHCCVWLQLPLSTKKDEAIEDTCFIGKMKAVCPDCSSKASNLYKIWWIYAALEQQEMVYIDSMHIWNRLWGGWCIFILALGRSYTACVGCVFLHKCWRLSFFYSHNPHINTRMTFLYQTSNPNHPPSPPTEYPICISMDNRTEYVKKKKNRLLEWIFLIFNHCICLPFSVLYIPTKK